MEPKQEVCDPESTSGKNGSEKRVKQPMSIRLEKDWQELNTLNIASLAAQLGVYQLADSNRQIIYIGYAGARSLFGLRSTLTRDLEENPGQQLLFRVEINMQYISRYEELLMLHVADYGAVPERNQPEGHTQLGRLSPT